MRLITGYSTAGLSNQVPNVTHKTVNIELSLIIGKPKLHRSFGGNIRVV